MSCFAKIFKIPDLLRELKEVNKQLDSIVQVQPAILNELKVVKKNFDALCDIESKIIEEFKAIHKKMDVIREIPSTPLELRKIATADSAQYIYKNFPDVGVFKYRQETLEYALKKVCIKGYFLEFGVFKGETITFLAKKKPEEHFWGFDSFEGLPEDWGGTPDIKETFNVGCEVPAVPSNVSLVKGWFDLTIPEWKKSNKGPIAFCHIDCDLYSSTVTVFKELEERFRPGTVLVFDEYFGYSDWKQGEHKAFLEMIERTKLKWQAKAISHMALVIEII